ncbi:hypothetical protein [Chroococcidiopsis sp. CCMEE 29]|uniref:hypothetical protein n=1 Tax=Chroococcidiopsis sp. CCMEE 29 TaxID=155894 RepID=UPI002020FA54|nr:hypothetical protein [Chroococcidiopsis sp. CCMEE 29]
MATRYAAYPICFVTFVSPLQVKDPERFQPMLQQRRVWAEDEKTPLGRGVMDAPLIGTDLPTPSRRTAGSE